MRRRLLAAVGGALLALTLTAAPAGGAGDEDRPARVLVSDAEQPVVSVFGDGEALGRFRLRAPAFLSAGPSGRYGYAAQGEGDQVAVVDGGGAGQPALLAFTLPGVEPSHVVGHGDQVAVFNDGDGTASVFEERALRDDRPEVTTLRTARGHHGVAVPHHDRVLVTLPDPADPNAELPVGVEVRDLAGRVLQTFSGCPELHGEAAAGDVVAFGCEDGVLLVRRDGEGYAASKVAYPEGGEEGAHATSLRGGDGLPYLVGNFGERALVRVDLEHGAAVALPVQAVLAAFDLDDQGRVVALTGDGHLRLLAHDGRQLRDVRVIPAFDPDGDWPLRPKLTVAGGSAYVTDARAGEVAEVDLESFTVADRLEVGGKPASVAVLEQQE